ncbi:unnamed protein product [Diabrotica balteata]|uniref:Gag-like protein n=1 Tax=Diabrotica balteata TaxID=107213 RepID=A0A9P0DSQ0_DIABA|nr:unnamed protein product [Diabrotica balteata]
METRRKTNAEDGSGRVSPNPSVSGTQGGEESPPLLRPACLTRSDLEIPFRCHLQRWFFFFCFCSNLNLRLSTNPAEKPSYEDNLRDLIEFIDNDMDKACRLNKTGRDGLKSRVMTIAMDLANMAGQCKILTEEVERLRKEKTVQRETRKKKIHSVDTENGVKEEVKPKDEDVLALYENMEQNMRLSRLEEFSILVAALRHVVRRLHPRGDKITFPVPDAVDRIQLRCSNIPSDANELLFLLKQVFSRRGEVFDLEELYCDFVKTYGRITTDYAQNGHYAKYTPGIHKNYCIWYYIVIPKCLKCLDLGHVPKHCGRETTCGHCGGAHEKKDCNKAGQPKTCIPCKYRNKSNCGKESNDCATYKLLMDRLIQKTDYDGQSKAPSRRLRDRLRLLSFRRKKKNVHSVESEIKERDKKDDVMALYENMELNMRLSRLEESSILVAALRHIVRKKYPKGDRVTFAVPDAVDRIQLKCSNIPTDADRLFFLLEKVFSRRGEAFYESSSLNLRLSENGRASERELTVEEKFQDLMEYVDNDMDPSKRLSKAGKEGLKTRLLKLAMEMASLTGQNKMLKEEVERLRHENNKRREITYAKIAAQPVAGTTKSEVQLKIETAKDDNTLFITSEKLTSGKKLQEEFTKLINPRTNKVRINKMRTTGKALIIETASKEDLNKIKSNKTVQENFKCENA